MEGGAPNGAVRIRVSSFSQMGPKLEVAIHIFPQSPWFTLFESSALSPSCCCWTALPVRVTKADQGRGSACRIDPSPEPCVCFVRGDIEEGSYHCYHTDPLVGFGALPDPPSHRGARLSSTPCHACSDRGFIQGSPSLLLLGSVLRVVPSGEAALGSAWQSLGYRAQLRCLGPSLLSLRFLGR